VQASSSEERRSHPFQGRLGPAQDGRLRPPPRPPAAPLELLARGRLTVGLLPGFVPWRWLTVGVVGDIFYQHAEGDVTQTWYRNEDQPAGTVIANIPYTIESLQYELGVRIGVAF